MSKSSPWKLTLRKNHLDWCQVCCKPVPLMGTSHRLLRCPTRVGLWTDLHMGPSRFHPWQTQWWRFASHLAIATRRCPLRIPRNLSKERSSGRHSLGRRNWGVDLQVNQSGARPTGVMQRFGACFSGGKSAAKSPRPPERNGLLKISESHIGSKNADVGGAWWNDPNLSYRNVDKNWQKSEGPNFVRLFGGPVTCNRLFATFALLGGLNPALDWGRSGWKRKKSKGTCFVSDFVWLDSHYTPKT